MSQLIRIKLVFVNQLPTTQTRVGSSRQMSLKVAMDVKIGGSIHKAGQKVNSTVIGKRRITH